MDTKNDCPEPPNACSLCTQLGSGFEKITGPLMAFPLASKQAPTRNTRQLWTRLQLTHTPPVSSPVSLNRPFSFLPPLCKVTTTINFTIPLFPSRFTSSFPKQCIFTFLELYRKGTLYLVFCDYLYSSGFTVLMLHSFSLFIFTDFTIFHCIGGEQYTHTHNLSILSTDILVVFTRLLL